MMREITSTIRPITLPSNEGNYSPPCSKLIPMTTVVIATSSMNSATKKRASLVGCGVDGSTLLLTCLCSPSVVLLIEASADSRFQNVHCRSHDFLFIWVIVCLLVPKYY
jgi:hypothetical protein